MFIWWLLEMEWLSVAKGLPFIAKLPAVWLTAAVPGWTWGCLDTHIGCIINQTVMHRCTHRGGCGSITVTLGSAYSELGQTEQPFALITSDVVKLVVHLAQWPTNVGGELFSASDITETLNLGDPSGPVEGNAFTMSVILPTRMGMGIQSFH